MVNLYRTFRPSKVLLTEARLTEGLDSLQITAGSGDFSLDSTAQPVGFEPPINSVEQMEPETWYFFFSKENGRQKKWSEKNGRKRTFTFLFLSGGPSWTQWTWILNRPVDAYARNWKCPTPSKRPSDCMTMRKRRFCRRQSPTKCMEYSILSFVLVFFWVEELSLCLLFDLQSESSYFSWFSDRRMPPVPSVHCMSLVPYVPPASRLLIPRLYEENRPEAGRIASLGPNGIIPLPTPSLVTKVVPMEEEEQLWPGDNVTAASLIDFFDEIMTDFFGRILWTKRVVYEPFKKWKANRFWWPVIVKPRKQTFDTRRDEIRKRD